MSRPAIRRLDGVEAAARAPALADLLRACVADGASVSFMAGLTHAEARAFWEGVACDVGVGGRILLVAEAGGETLGTVQVVPAPQPNQPHRADIAKMLVRPDARGLGLGAALLEAAEAAARGAGRWLLVLDTVPGMAGDRLYARAGWTEAGVIPDYALLPDGSPCATRIFYKDLRRASG